MKAVIFDLGGVLVHYDHQATLAAITAVCQPPPGTPAPDLPGQIPAEIIYQFGTGQINGRQFHRYLVDHLSMTPDFDTFNQAFCRHMQRHETALNDAVALAQRPFVKVGIISNTNEAHAAWLRTHVPELSRFDSVILSSDVGLLKPDPFIYKRSLAELGVNGETAVFIDDTLTNVSGAQDAGLHGIHHQDWPQTKTAVENWLKTSS